jgi:hypothetical protein
MKNMRMKIVFLMLLGFAIGLWVVIGSGWKNPKSKSIEPKTHAGHQMSRVGHTIPSDAKPVRGADPEKSVNSYSAPTTKDDYAQLEALTNIDADELMNMKWDSLSADTSFSNRKDVLRVVSSFTRTGITVDQHVSEALTSMLGDVLMFYGTNDLASYFRWLKESNETIRPEVIPELRNSLTQELHIPPQDIPEDSFDLLGRFVEKAAFKTHWNGLVGEGSSIHFFEATTTELPSPGKTFQDLRHKIVSYHHITKSPREPSQIISSKGKVLFSDVTVLIAHSEEVGNIVRPYVMRLWYDPEANIWRPFPMSGFPSMKDGYPCQLVF